MDNLQSVFLNINIGVPQGSVLGSTLFLIYTLTIMPYNLTQTHQIILYADDIDNMFLPVILPVFYR